MTTLTLQDLLSTQTIQCAPYFAAFRECSPEVQEIVLDMAAIIADADSSEDERGHAVDVMVEALFPGMAADLMERHEKAMHHPESEDVRAALDAEEAAFAERVRFFMREKSLTQQMLADQLGIGQSAVANMLNRQCRPQQRTVARFAKALGVSPEELWPISPE